MPRKRKITSKRLAQVLCVGVAYLSSFVITGPYPPPSLPSPKARTWTLIVSLFLFRGVSSSSVTSPNASRSPGTESPLLRSRVDTAGEVLVAKGRLTKNARKACNRLESSYLDKNNTSPYRVRGKECRRTHSSRPRPPRCYVPRPLLCLRVHVSLGSCFGPPWEPCRSFI